MVQQHFWFRVYHSAVDDFWSDKKSIWQTRALWLSIPKQTLGAPVQLLLLSVINSAKANIELCLTPLLLEFVFSLPALWSSVSVHSIEHTTSLKGACKNRLAKGKIRFQSSTLESTTELRNKHSLVRKLETKLWGAKLGNKTLGCETWKQRLWCESWKQNFRVQYLEAKTLVWKCKFTETPKSLIHKAVKRAGIDLKEQRKNYSHKNRRRDVS